MASPDQQPQSQAWIPEQLRGEAPDIGESEEPRAATGGNGQAPGVGQMEFELPSGGPTHPKFQNPPDGRRPNSNEWPDIGHELKDRILRLAFFFLAIISVVIDSGFVLAWLWVHKQVHGLVDKIGLLKGLGHDTAMILEGVFSYGTLLLVLSYVAHDLVVSIVRPWKGGLGGRPKSDR